MNFNTVLYPDDWAQYTGNGDDFPYPRYLMITRQELQDGLDSITKNYFQLPLLAVSAIQVYNSTVGAPESWAHSHDQVKLHAPEIEVTRYVQSIDMSHTDRLQLMNQLYQWQRGLR